MCHQICYFSNLMWIHMWFKFGVLVTKCVTKFVILVSQCESICGLFVPKCVDRICHFWPQCDTKCVFFMHHIWGCDTPYGTILVHIKVEKSNIRVHTLRTQNPICDQFLFHMWISTPKSPYWCTSTITRSDMST